MGPGWHWFRPGAGEGFQGEERIRVDILAMTCVHWELSKCKMSLSGILLQKSGYKGTSPAVG